MINGQTQYNPPSRFVREIPKALLDEPAGKKPGKTELPSSRKSDIPKPQRPAAKPFVLQKGASLSPGRVDYGVGDRVRHKKFGEGVVKELVKDTKDYKVTVDFDTSGTKILYAAFARLEKC